MPQNQAVIVLKPHLAGVVDVLYPDLVADDHMIVRTTALAINPTDWKHVAFEGEWSSEGLGCGFDYAGVVEHVGPAVTKNFKTGDRVAGCAQGSNYFRKSDGAFARYISVKSSVQMKIPDNITDAEAASLGVSIFTTALGLYQSLDLPLPPKVADEPFWIFIYGGSTAMGVSMIQFAKLSGAKVVTTSSPANEEYVKSLGADHVLNYKSPTLQDDVQNVLNGPLKYAVDCHADEASVTLCTKLLEDQGRLSALGGAKKVAQYVNPHVQVYTPLGYSAFGEKFWFGKTFEASTEDLELAAKFIDLSQELYAQGKLKPPRIVLNQGGSGLEGTVVGMEDLKNGKVSGGKLVYTM